MTSEPSSVLADQGRDTGPLVAKLAMELIKNVRDEETTFRERPKDRKDTKNDHSSDFTERLSPIVTLSPGIGSAEATTSLNQALAGQAESMQNKISFPFPSPFGSFISRQQQGNLQIWVTNILVGKDMTRQLRQYPIPRQQIPPLPTENSHLFLWSL